MGYYILINLLVNHNKQEYYGNLSEDENNKKRNYANIRNKNMSDADRKRGKMNIKNYYYERNVESFK